MTKILPKILVLPDFLASSCQGELLARTLSSQELFEGATVYDCSEKKVDPSRRRSQKMATRHGALIEPFVAAFSQRMMSFFGEIGMSVRPIVRLETEIAAYNEGGFFREHVDTLTGAIQSEQGFGQARAMSAVYYFHRQPKGFDGGALRFWSFGENRDREFRDVEPTNNALVVFPSFAPHEVRPVYCSSRKFEDSRFAINCWVHCNI